MTDTDADRNREAILKLAEYVDFIVWRMAKDKEKIDIVEEIREILDG